MQIVVNLALYSLTCHSIVCELVCGSEMASKWHARARYCWISKSLVTAGATILETYGRARHAFDVNPLSRIIIDPLSQRKVGLDLLVVKN